MVTGGFFILAENSIMRNEGCKLNPCNVKLEIIKFFPTLKVVTFWKMLQRETPIYLFKISLD